MIPILLSLLSVLVSPSQAHAGSYPWVGLGADDIRVIEDTKVDFQLRLQLIKNAKESIDIAVYDLRPDNEFTFPLMEALREAADRNVQVRFITSWIPMLAFDKLKSIPHYLLEPPTKKPIEYVFIGGRYAQNGDYSRFDTVHEKLFIVDHKSVLTTGRGFGENYLYWLDTNFAIKGALVAQSQEAFDALWSSGLKQRGLFKGDAFWHIDRYKTVKHYGLTAKSALDSTETAELAALDLWLSLPSQPAEARPSRARVLHYDFLAQWQVLLKAGIRPVDEDQAARLIDLDDPVIDALEARLAHAREVRMNILSIELHPRLKAALLAARQAGAHVQIMTNQASPSLGDDFEKKTIEAGGLLWNLELADMDDLAAAGCEIYAFETYSDTPWIYMHRKLAVIDDAVIFGSHNFNLPSTTNNDEVSFEVENAAFARQMAAIFDRDVGTNSVALLPRYIHRERESLGARILGTLFWPLLPIM